MYLCQPTRGWGRMGEYNKNIRCSSRALLWWVIRGFHWLPPARRQKYLGGPPSRGHNTTWRGWPWPWPRWAPIESQQVDGAWSARSSGLTPRPSRSTAWVTGATAPLFHLLRSTCSSRLSDTTHSKSLVTGHAPPRYCRGLPPTVAVRTKVYCSA
jgi:hypothetical protein